MKVAALRLRSSTSKKVISLLPYIFIGRFELYKKVSILEKKSIVEEILSIKRRINSNDHLISLNNQKIP